MGIVLCHCPLEVQKKSSMQEWFGIMSKVCGAQVLEETETTMKAEVIADIDKGIYPFKLKDAAIGQCYGWLQSKKLVLADDSDDDVVYGDDDFPDYFEETEA